MNSMFDRLNAPTEDVIDTVFAEEFAFQPMREVKNGDPVDDTSRSPIECLTALWVDPAHRMDVSNGGGISMAMDSPKIIVQAEIFCGADNVKRPDRFIRKRDGATYEVRQVKPEGIARVVVDLVEAS